MSENIPVYTGEPTTPEDVRLITLFDEMRKTQLERIDEAGKRIIELSTAMLGVLFGVTAFGDKFPPPYLADNVYARGFVILVLFFYTAALLLGLLTVQPRNYPHSPHNLTAMQENLSEINVYKASRMKWASAIFFIATIMLSCLIGSIIFFS